MQRGACGVTIRRMSKREGTPSVPPHQRRAKNAADEAETRRSQPVDDVADSTATEEQSQETAEAPHAVPSSELRRAHELADELVAE